MTDPRDYASDGEYLSAEEAREYATAVATEAIEAYKKLESQTNTKGNSMNTTTTTNLVAGVEEVAESVMSETALNAKLNAGEALYENIETLVEKYILDKLTWWQKLTISTKQKRLATLVGVYVVIHAIKSGGFGLTKYRINHPSIELVTLACNRAIQKEFLSGFDTNIVKALMTAPKVSTEGGTE